MGKKSAAVPERMIQRLSKGGLLILVSTQGDGATYGLDPRAQLRLKDVTPNKPRPRSVYLGHDDDSQFEALHTPHWPQIVEILTGLRLEQLAPFAPVYIFSPHDPEKIFWEWKPEAVTRAG